MICIPYASLLNDASGFSAFGIFSACLSGITTLSLLGVVAVKKLPPSATPGNKETPMKMVTAKETFYGTGQL